MSKLLLRTLQVIVGMGVITGAVIWLSGGFRERIAPGTVEPDAGAPPPAIEVAEVEVVTQPAFEWASGTLASARHTVVASRILPRIDEVRVRAGDNVTEGDILVVLDSRELESRARQVKEALGGAKARLELARVEKERVETLLRRGTGTQQRLDQAASQLRVAQAEVDRLRQSLAEAQTALSYTIIQSPVSGRVIDRLAEPGDTVSPGSPLLRVYDPKGGVKANWLEGREARP